MSSPFTIGVIGAGAWGTALAIHLAKLHPTVKLWGRSRDHLNTIFSDQENKRYLPGVPLPNNLTAEPELDKLIAESQYLIIATPSQIMRELMQQISSQPHTNLSGIIWACKGLEHNTGKFLHQVAAEELNPSIKNSILSGPSFAEEVGRGLPTAVTIASNSLEYAQESANLFHHSLFRTYTSTDVSGVEIGGTFKNILAIASGIIDGLNFGANARAALITRGVAEMIRFGKHMNVNPETFIGLSGIGDIVLTCTENMSRNRRLGLGLGAGKAIEEVETEIGQVIEGKYAAKVVYLLAQKLNIELPISTQVYEVIYSNKPAKQAVEDLLSRSLKYEPD